MSVGPIEKPAEPVNLPQFRLRTLFVVVGLFSVLFAIMGIVGPIGSAAILLVLAAVGLHVAGNALGTTLRDQSPRQSVEPIAPDALAATSIRYHQGPRSRLYQRTRMGWLSWASAVCGGLAAGWIASAVLVQGIGISIFGRILGTASSSVLGVFFGFLAGSFLQMALAAWWQASSDSQAIGRSSACPPEFTQV